jgi:hypothetical protein
MRRTFLQRWVISVTVGESIGFVIPAAVGGVLAMIDVSGWVTYIAMIFAGACEGMLLGLGQSLGFGSDVVPRSRWVAVTAAGGALAWSLGMLPSSIPGLDLASPITVLWAAVGGVLLLVSIPAMQWIVLRRLVPKSFRWVPVNAGAWAVGILWTLAPSPFIDETTAPPVLLALYVLAGFLMAFTVALLTGFTARRIALGPHESRPGQAKTSSNLRQT